MSASNEFALLAPQADAAVESADLINAMAQGLMSQLDLMGHVQHLESLGELRAAANLYALWINHAKATDKHFALFNYGGMLQNLQRPQEALEAYAACIALKAEFPQPYINLGLLHEKLGQDALALQTWLRLVSRRYLDKPPTDEFLTMALNHIGRLQEKLKNYAQAEQALEESLSINPAQPGVIQHWVHIRQKACQWPIYKRLPGVSLAEMKRYTSPLAMLALTEDPAEQLLNAQSFVARTYALREERLSQGCAYQHPRVRVGYVSADFREHAVGFLLPSLMDGHGATFELFAYDYSPEERTPLREHLKGQFDHFRSIKALSDRQAAELILADEIDILIDLHGLSSGARPGIFALHPAPQQGTYLGFMGPTGMPWFDFVIADRHVLPDELAVYFTEKPLHVEGSYLPMVSYADSAPVLTREPLGLPEGAFVMGAFGNTYKITPEMFGTWMCLLRRIPDALLWLVDDNESSTTSLKAQAQAAGVGLDRLVFSSRTTHPEFCARLKLVDVYLDTYPYNCGSTSNDVIHAGVPLVTMYGKTLVSRMGLSLMSALNSASNATRTYAEYEDKVVELAIKKKAGKLPVALPQGEPLRIGQALARLRQPSSQAGAVPASTAVVRPGVQLFQICYTEETRQSIPAGFAELDNLANERPDWREFWPMRNYLMTHALEEDVFYGFFSPRFSYKTGLDFEKIREFAQQHGADHDVLIFSPFWDLNSLFINSFEQGEFFHPGLMACSQQFLQAVGKDLRLSELVMHGDNTAFCNYFIAKKKFWLHWLELGEKLYQSAEAEGTVLAHALNQNTIYSHDLLPLKIFVQERLVNMLLAGPEFKSLSRSWSMFGLPCSITPLSQYKSLAVTANALKMAHTHTGEALYLNEFHQLRDKVWKDSGIDEMAKARDRILRRNN
jgi:predicted O-linked N-acetylglucosamine transferase (SPINDLY family)